MSEFRRTDRVRRLLANRRGRWIVMAAGLLAVVVGVSVGFATARSTTAAQPTTTSSSVGGSGSGGRASNARSGPAAGGSAGTVDNVSTSGFTMTTSAGQTVTVNETPSTTYRNGTSSTSV